jgi:hypothetical protein
MFRLRILVFALCVSVATLSAQAPVRLKLATLAPENSPWHTALADIRANDSRAGHATLGAVDPRSAQARPGASRE